MNKKLLFTTLTGVLLLASCGQNNTTPRVCEAGTTLQNGACVTVVNTGVLNITNPNGYTVVVKDAAGAVVPAASYGTLAPGNYSITYSRDGYNPQTANFGITAGQTSYVIAPTLSAITPVTPSGAYYIDAAGKMQPIPQADINNAGSRFVLYAWLEDEANGVTPAGLGAGAAPTAGEQEEIAPLGTQNLAGAYVGYRAADGKVYPVVGASVRWDIYKGNIRFAASDDSLVASGSTMQPLWVNDNMMSASTFTNSATGNNVRFPSSANYPLNNMTGVGSPDTSGFTWTALWVPAPVAKPEVGDGMISVVASINGTEIDKTVLHKIFAPSAKLSITKTPADQTVVVNQDGTFTITVKNIGNGPANNIKLNDVLTSGSAAAYTAVTPTGGTANTTDGFDATFNLAPGESKAFTFTARSSETGKFCDTATVLSYDNGQFGTVSSTDLKSTACMTVTAPALNITKTLVTRNADGTYSSLANGTTVGRNTEVFAQITVSNTGDATATNVVVTDALSSGTVAANYAIKTAAVGTSLVGDDGFTSTAFNLDKGASKSFIFGAVGTADGKYCDVGSVTATNIPSKASNEVCFNVTSPTLSITKTNAPKANLVPGNSYTSTITVTNTGAATATGVAVSDVLGLNGSTYVNVGSGTFTVNSNPAQTGSYTYDAATHTISTQPATVNLAPGQNITFTVTSTIPAGAPRGEYCDVASFNSTNAGSGTARDCVNVTSFLAYDQQIADTTDPITAGVDSTQYTARYGLEPSSNEGARNNVIKLFIGTDDGVQETPGIFTYSNVVVRYTPNVARNADGIIIQDVATVPVLDPSNYTISAANGTGAFTVDFADDFVVAPGGAIYVQFTAAAPAGSGRATPYNTNSRWTNNAVSSGAPGKPFMSTSTSVK